MSNHRNLEVRNQDYNLQVADTDLIESQFAIKELKMKLKEKREELKLNELKVKELKLVVPKHKKFISVDNSSYIENERTSFFDSSVAGQMTTNVNNQVNMPIKLFDKSPNMNSQYSQVKRQRGRITFKGVRV